MTDIAIVLASGGMDSTVTATLARRQHKHVALMHVRYGQRTSDREFQAFSAVADHLDVPDELRLVVNIDYLSTIGGSALTDRTIDVPLDEPLDGDTVPVSYVPQRNGNLLFVAAAWAEVLKAESIWTGIVEEDSSGYPDCRESFVEAMERAIALGNDDTSHDPRVVTPLIAMRKSEIVRMGSEINAPLHLTWSCYRDEDRACGRCDSCRLRLRGFAEAGMKDPIPYAVAAGPTAT
jgi:7-cyano-7-deazaguanine synthase